MKTWIKNLFLLSALVAGLGAGLAGRVMAQTFTILHSFTATSGSPSTNSDGAVPNGLILSNNILYGTAAGGGSSGAGTVFAFNADGTGFTNLHSFTATSVTFPHTNSEGANPNAGLMLSNYTLYGTTPAGGSWGEGAVFKLNTDGTGFTNLHSFTAEAKNGAIYTNSDGVLPFAGLILSSNILYGTAYQGGTGGFGTVFKVNTDGGGFMTLHNFTLLPDGGDLLAGLLLSGNALFGAASSGGSSRYYGTVFAVNTDGSGFTNLNNFTSSDGAGPNGLLLTGNTLYGTAQQGGSSGFGAVFRVNTDGSGFTNFYNFTGGSDGANPYAGLILSNNTLYGTAAHGGSPTNGTVFKVNTDGTGFTTLHSFTPTSGSASTNDDGANPITGLILSGNTLYGTAGRGGNSGKGTVFSLSLGAISAPQLTIVPSGTNVVLTWPTNAAVFTLQCTTNLVPPVWTIVSPDPVVVNGQNTVTNSVSGTQKFYRLSE